jgi:hypothetical protein
MNPGDLEVRYVGRVDLVEGRETLAVPTAVLGPIGGVPGERFCGLRCIEARATADQAEEEGREQ